MNETIDTAMRWLFWGGLAAGFLLICAYVARWIDRRHAHQRIEHAESAERHRKNAEAAMRLAPDWRAGVCVVCLKAPATCALPVITKSRLQVDPTDHRSLHAVSQMWRLEEDPVPGREACLSCQRMVWSEKSRRLADIRARQASINAESAEEVHRIESGEVIRDVQRRVLGHQQTDFAPIEAPQLPSKPAPRTGMMQLGRDEEEPNDDG